MKSVMAVLDEVHKELKNATTYNAICDLEDKLEGTLDNLENCKDCSEQCYSDSDIAMLDDCLSKKLTWVRHRKKNM